MILAILAAIVVVLLGLIGWCVWRFCKKKRPKGEEKEIDEDEKDLVNNEEEVAEEIEEPKGNEDFKGKIQYKLEYDFTTQELKVTVRASSFIYFFSIVYRLRFTNADLCLSVGVSIFLTHPCRGCKKIKIRKLALTDF